MLDYLDNDRHHGHPTRLRISGALVLALALVMGIMYVLHYGLPQFTHVPAQAQAPTLEPTPLPTPTPRPGEFVLNPTDLVLPTDGQFAATGTQLFSRHWLRQVPMVVLKQYVFNWMLQHHTEYAQKYYLSCEVAIIRMSLAPLGIHLTEDQILADIPFHPSDPEKGLVIEDINGSTYHEDGSINWGNYGAHAPAVAQMLNWYLQRYGLDDLISVEIQALNDDELADTIASDPDLIGAIIWVARGPDGGLPPTNSIGQVLGEHVQWVSPILDEDGNLVIFDVWPWPDQPFHTKTTLNRQLFQYRTILLRRIN